MHLVSIISLYLLKIKRFIAVPKACCFKDLLSFPLCVPLLKNLYLVLLRFKHEVVQYPTHVHCYIELSQTYRGGIHYHKHLRIPLSTQKNCWHVGTPTSCVCIAKCFDQQSQNTYYTLYVHMNCSNIIKDDNSYTYIALGVLATYTYFSIKVECTV